MARPAEFRNAPFLNAKIDIAHQPKRLPTLIDAGTTRTPAPFWRRLTLPCQRRVPLFRRELVKLPKVEIGESTSSCEDSLCLGGQRCFFFLPPDEGD